MSIESSLAEREKFVEISAISNDHKLKTLKLALDPAQMRGPLASLARKRLGEAIEVQDIDIEIIRRRSKRCVIRYRIVGYDSDRNRAIDWRVVGKVYKQNRGERVFDVMQELWSNGFSREAGDGLSIPEPLEFSSQLCMLFQEEVPGRPAKAFIRRNSGGQPMRQLARTLAKLHKCRLAPAKPMTIEDHLSRCHPQHSFLTLAVPELESSILQIVETAKRVERSFSPVDHTPIHGDFHLGQVHLENGDSWLIDFDALSRGDPAADLGNLLVFLKSKKKKHPGIERAVESFLDEYFSVMDSRIAERIPLYEGLTHLRRACKRLRLQEQGWQRKATRMIDQGVACVESLGIQA